MSNGKDSGYLSIDCKIGRSTRNFRRLAVSRASTAPVTLSNPAHVQSAKGELMTARLRYFAVTLVLFFAIFSCSTPAAYAYVDPGSGLLAYQSITAFLTGVMFYFRRRLKVIFLRDRADEDKA